jgi:hypothetical protein
LNAVLFGREAVPANGFVALGVINGNPATRIEQWNGTNWSISSPDPGTAFNALYAVTALGDGTVDAVGTQEDSNTGNATPLVVQN